MLLLLSPCYLKMLRIFENKNTKFHPTSWDVRRCLCNYTMLMLQAFLFWYVLDNTYNQALIRNLCYQLSAWMPPFSLLTRLGQYQRFHLVKGNVRAGDTHKLRNVGGGGAGLAWLGNYSSETKQDILVTPTLRTDRSQISFLTMNFHLIVTSTPWSREENECVSNHDHKSSNIVHFTFNSIITVKKSVQHPHPTWT